MDQLMCASLFHTHYWYEVGMFYPYFTNHEKHAQAEQGFFFFPCPHSRQRIFSRETGSAVPSRVSLLILHTQAESDACSRDSFRFPRRRLYIHAVTRNRHRVSPESIGSRNCVSVTFTAGRKSTGAGPVVLKVVPVTGATLPGLTMGPIV